MKKYNKGEFRAECERRRKAGLVLTGNTYVIKDRIKAAGGIWDGYRKAWLVPDEETLRRLAGMLPAPTTRSRRRRRTCDCTDPDCCNPCMCEPHCVCRGGNIYDC